MSEYFKIQNFIADSLMKMFSYIFRNCRLQIWYEVPVYNKTGESKKYISIYKSYNYHFVSLHLYFNITFIKQNFFICEKKSAKVESRLMQQNHLNINHFRLILSCINNINMILVFQKQ